MSSVLSTTNLSNQQNISRKIVFPLHIWNKRKKIFSLSHSRFFTLASSTRFDISEPLTETDIQKLIPQYIQSLMPEHSRR